MSKRALMAFSVGGSAFLAVAAMWLWAPREGDAAAEASSNSDASRLAIQRQFARLPLSFEPNIGQSDPRVEFLARGPGYTMFLTPSETVFRLLAPNPAGKQADAGSTAVRMSMVGSNPAPAIEGLSPRTTTSNYFTGGSSAEWKTEVPHFEKVQYSDVYPGVDVVYYGNLDTFEYDFVVAPGADPDQILLAFDGVDKLRVDPAGNLLIGTPHGDLVQKKPVVYQEKHGRRESVQGRYELLADNRIAFALGQYDRDRALVIDPVIEYSTYLGGLQGDTALDIALDSNGHVYVAGATASTDFPESSPWIQGSLKGEADAFIAKFDATGSNLMWTTYLGGSGAERAESIAVDLAGSVYITGSTHAVDFPVTAGAPQPDKAASGYDAFVSKISSSGGSLEFSTYLGGTGDDRGFAIAVDNIGSIFVAGATTSRDFPVSSPIQPAYADQPNSSGYEGDGFVVKYRNSGSVAFSTYLGGSLADSVEGIAVDIHDDIYLTGNTDSHDFPVRDPFQSFNRTGGPSQYFIGDAFVAKLKADGSALLYSSHLGGEGEDYAEDIALDPDGNAYVIGTTNSDGFPTVSAYQPAKAAGIIGSVSDAFITKVHSSGAGLVYSTYLGGTEWDEGFAIAVDRDGNAYIGGHTRSVDFPTASAIQRSKSADWDGFVGKFTAAGGLAFSTYLGGSAARGGDAEEPVTGLAVDAYGDIYVTGWTWSTDFPVVDAVFPNLAGWTDSYVTKINPSGHGDPEDPDDPDPPTATLPVGVIRTVAGNGEDVSSRSHEGGPATQLGIGWQNSVAADVFGNFHFDRFRVSRTGALTYHPGWTSDGSIATDRTGERYVINSRGIYHDTPMGSVHMGTPYLLSRWHNSSGLAIDATGKFYYYASFGVPGYPNDDWDRTLVGVGYGGSARTGNTSFPGIGQNLWGIDLDGAGNVYFCGAPGIGVVKWSVSTRLYSVISPDTPCYSLAADDAGNVFYIHGAAVKQITPEGVIRTIAGESGFSGFSGDGGYAPLAMLNSPRGVSVDGAGDVYIADSGNKRIRKIVMWRGPGSQADFKRDNQSDIHWYNDRTGAGAIWNNGRYGDQTAVTTIRQLAWKVVGTGDFNGDRRTDILWRDMSRGSNVIWQSGSYRSQQAVTGVTNLAWEVAGIGDFDGDGRSDILWRDRVRGANAIWKGGDYRNQQAVTAVTSLDWKVAGVGDFNADGRSDILWRNTVTGANTAWLGGNYSSQMSIRTVSDTRWSVAGIGDFNGDGKSDVVWRHATTGSNALWKSANFSDQMSITGITDRAWKIVGTGDYSGDGKADLLWRHDRSGRNAIWRNADYQDQQSITDVTNTAWKVMP